MKETAYRVLTGVESRTKMYNELNNNKLLLSQVLSSNAFLKFLRKYFPDTVGHILLDVLDGMKPFLFHLHFNFGRSKKVSRSHFWSLVEMVNVINPFLWKIFSNNAGALSCNNNQLLFSWKSDQTRLILCNNVPSRLNKTGHLFGTNSFRVIRNKITSIPFRREGYGIQKEPASRTHNKIVTSSTEKNKKFWEELIAYFPVIRHKLNSKWRVRQFFHCCVCIRCRSNVFTDPLHSNDKGIYIQTHKSMGGIYEVGRCDGLRCLDICTKFHKDWFSYSKVYWGGDTERHKHYGDRISLLLFLQSKESTLKIQNTAFRMLFYITFFYENEDSWQRLLLPDPPSERIIGACYQRV
jgi:hypothetical protein